MLNEFVLQQFGVVTKAWLAHNRFRSCRGFGIRNLPISSGLAMDMACAVFADPIQLTVQRSTGRTPAAGT
jgi:hypothetical protein